MQSLVFNKDPEIQDVLLVQHILLCHLIALLRWLHCEFDLTFQPAVPIFEHVFSSSGV